MLWIEEVFLWTINLLIIFAPILLHTLILGTMPYDIVYDISKSQI